MDSIISENNYQDSLTYQILGDEAGARQTLQLVLMPQQSVVVHDRALMYSSENIEDKTSSLTSSPGGGMLVSLALSTITSFFGSIMALLNTILSTLLGQRVPQRGQRETAGGLKSPLSSHVNMYL